MGGMMGAGLWGPGMHALTGQASFVHNSSMCYVGDEVPLTAAFGTLPK